MSVANVATRWVLEQPAVAAVIVGARLGEREHRADNAALFSFALDEEDKTRIDAALARRRASRRLRRRVPAAALPHGVGRPQPSPGGLPPVYAAVPVDGRPDRLRVDSGSVWEPICGYSRAVRMGDRILVSGTTATHGTGEVVCPGDLHGQTVYILDKIAASTRRDRGRSLIG